ncbi:hypothetical protein N8Z75_01525 [Crocinitomicaceae bacterium]|nr:hypothetical protein [Crocinitomicaceae bacterium]
MSETEDLKEWIKIHFSDYDKSRFDLYMKEKKGYAEGVEKFYAKDFNYPSSVKLELRNGAGLMELSRVQGRLFEYGYHCYRQIELVYSQFFDAQPGRFDIGKFLLGADFNQLNTHYSNNNKSDNFSFSSIINSTVKKKLNYNEHLGYPEFRSCFVRKINNYEWQYNGNYWRLKNKDMRLSFKDKDRIFKASMFFNPFVRPSKQNKSEPATQFDWPSLNAFEVIYHCRNKYAHLGIESSSISSVFGDRKLNMSKSHQENNFVNDPDLILESDYFERYVNMVIGLYSELHKKNYNLRAFHGMD